MSRISIDVTVEEHQRLKALAALHGKSIKEFVLERTIGQAPAASSPSQALADLENLVEERLRETRENGVSPRSVREITESRLGRGSRRPNA